MSESKNEKKSLKLYSYKVAMIVLAVMFVMLYFKLDGTQLFEFAKYFVGAIVFVQGLFNGTRVTEQFSFNKYVASNGK